LVADKLTHKSRDGTLGHQFNKRVESFAPPRYSQSLLLADLKKTILFSGFENPYKKIREIRKLESVHERHFAEWKSEGRKPRQKVESE
jgi:hypothetical protein